MSPFDTPAILLTSDGGALSSRANRKFAAGAGAVATVLHRRHKPSKRRESGRRQLNILLAPSVHHVPRHAGFEADERRRPQGYASLFERPGTFSSHISGQW